MVAKTEDSVCLSLIEGSEAEDLCCYHVGPASGRAAASGIIICFETLDTERTDVTAAMSCPETGIRRAEPWALRKFS